MSEKLIYNKLFTEKPVELSSEKVELTSVADLKQAANKAFKLIEDSGKALGDYVDAKNKVREAEGAMMDYKSDFDKMKTDFFKKAKDLGIAPASIEEYKLAVEAQNALDKELTKARKATK